MYPSLLPYRIVCDRIRPIIIPDQNRPKRHYYTTYRSESSDEEWEEDKRVIKIFEGSKPEPPGEGHLEKGKDSFEPDLFRKYPNFRQLLCSSNILHPFNYMGIHCKSVEHGYCYQLVGIIIEDAIKARIIATNIITEMQLKQKRILISDTADVAWAIVRTVMIILEIRHHELLMIRLMYNEKPMMTNLMREQLNQHPDLKNMLLLTGDAKIYMWIIFIRGNNHWIHLEWMEDLRALLRNPQTS